MACLLRSATLALASTLACGDAAYGVRDAGDAGGLGDDGAAAMVASDGAVARADARARDDAGEELIALKDAAVPTETTADGGEVSLVPAMPEWATPLLGHYAARSYNFAQDSFGVLIRTREYLVIDVVQTPAPDAHVELQLHMCDSFGEGKTADTRVVAPEYTSPRTHRVLFGDRSWATQSPDTADGFTRALPERCQGKEGTQVPKDPAQTWIVGALCTCPGSVDVAPNKPEDCRIIDQDRDGAPGSSMRITPKVLGLGPATLHIATVNRTTFLNGTVGSDGRHTAQLAIDQAGWQLSCDPLGCADISQTPAPCPPSRSKLELVRQDEGFACRDVIDHATTLFPNGLPADPPRCP